ncbi:histidyl-tRNA synthetase [Streptococcus criceti]|uniref:ATP phosphoribosyltransferase regulatory subunit n=1 Tax=Streptococcus criceti HS-6 TaxID=873449 RepID=G5JQB9_STRCG|nr:ATP phosphoribosyltransferase regulatory subunit [Streptococcus criceti]EHI75441.1 putative ATP phosphoribosyltransferase, regulatory subunit [Streptococcus criceti HS-6]SUN43093.1 histidyl-tRNA synthetase [Streptococcus criceti]
MKKTTLPVGMHDKLFKKAATMYRLERDISDLLIERQFRRIETPTLEHTEVFGDELKKTHYHLFDKSGDLLSLRPDITSQIGRVIASTQVETPIKFSYSGKVFHYNEELRGLLNEHTQAGVEIVGYPADKALKEAVLSAKSALDVAGVKVYQFEFSHAAILQTIYDELDLDDISQHQLEGAIIDKNITALHTFTEKHPSKFDTFIEALPFLFGESHDVLTQARALVKDRRILKALDNLEDLLGDIYRFLPQTTIDLAQVPSLPYYTGMMFKVFGENVPDAFVSGGRYDKLFERFGATELTAVGWAVDLDSIYQAIHDNLERGTLR